jgi:molecular chaperone DnaJ
MAKRDYYEVLGVPRTANPDEIKSAYRRLARENHPDVAKGNPKAAEERFKEISEAYEVLADEEKRRRYDQMGFSGVESDFGPGGFGWQNFTHSQDLEDLIGASPLFQQLFGNFGSSFGGIPRRDTNRGGDLEVTVRLPLKAAVEGASPEIEVPHLVACPDCRGTGARDGTALETCPECHGQGQVRRVQNRGFTQLISIGECPRCRGTGRRILEKCPACRGTGQQQKVERIRITVPAGIEEGTVLRVPGHGGAGRNGGRPGNLFVQVLFEAIEGLRRDGRDVHAEATVPLATALLGGEVTVPTLEGRAALTVPPGTQPETQFRMRGRGFPEMGGRSRGDELVTVHVEIPRSLPGRSQELVREALGGPPKAASRRDSLFRRRSS